MQKTLPLFLFFSLISFWLFAQPGRIQQQPKDSVVEKVWFHKELTVRNNAGNIIEVTGWKNTKKHGERKLFTNDGKPKEVSNWENGLLDGEKKVYDYKGRLSAVRNYMALTDENKSVLDGKSKQYQNGEITSETEYKNGEKTGAYTFYYRNGEIKEEGHYKKGIKTGTVENFNKDGDLVYHQEFVVSSFNGGKKTSVKEGHFLLFDTESNLIEDFHYKNGLKTGICKTYDRKTHNLTTLNTFKKGKRHGAYTYYFDNGDLRESGNFYRKIEVGGEVLENVYNGERLRYHENGQLKSKAIWKNYQLNGVTKGFYKDGKLSSIATYKNGLKTGSAKQWDDKGQPREFVNYKIIQKDSVRTSVKDGIEKKWYKGNLSAVQDYSNGLKDGFLRIYHPNGHLKLLRHFKNDEQDGIDKSFYKDGTLKSKETHRATDYGHEQIGWGYRYDKKGQLSSRYFADRSGDIIISYSFRDGENLIFDVGHIVHLEFLPAGKLKTLQLIWKRSLNFEFFSNGSLRKIEFSVPDTWRTANANFSSAGKLLSVHKPEDSKYPSKALDNRALKIQKQFNPKWIKSDFIQDRAKSGGYQLNFPDGSTFIKAAFKDSLPQGNWMIRNPLKNDTLFYAEFAHGKFVGKYVRKDLDAIISERKKFNRQGKIMEDRDYFQDGTLKNKTRYNPDGSKSLIVGYNEDGKLLKFQNLDKGTRFNKKENGKLYNRTFLEINGKDTTQIREMYYPEIDQMRQKRFYNRSTKKGSVATFHKNGQKQSFHEMFKRESNGLYQKFNEKGNLITEGHFKNGRRDGSWKEFEDGKEVKSYRYKNGEIIINPKTETPCACYDKSLRNDEVGFANSLNYMLEGFENVKPYLPSFIVPFKNFNSDAIFFGNFNGSGGNRNTSFFQMKLFLYDELSFFLPANKKLKINLNPCRTEGYINNLRANFSFNTDTEKLRSARFSTNKIAISLEENPLKAEGSNPFTGFFDVETVDISDKDIELVYRKDSKPCFPLGKLNGFMDIDITDAKPVIQIEKTHRRGSVKYYKFPIIEAEAEDFYGFAITEATVNFDFVQKGKSIPVQASTEELYAGSNFVAGELKVKGKVIADATFKLSSNQQVISLKSLKEFLSDKGFYRLKLETNTKGNLLKIQFFTE